MRCDVRQIFGIIIIYYYIISVASLCYGKIKG